MPDVIFTTGRDMPRVPPDDGALFAALAELGVTAELRRWDKSFVSRTDRLVMVHTAWDYCTRLAEFLSWAQEAERRTQLRNPARILRWNSHKGYMVELAASGVPAVPTTIVSQGSGERLRATALQQHAGADVVVKPAVSSGARGALLGAASAPATRRHLELLTSSGDALVQPFTTSVCERGESSLIFFGADFSHAVRKIPAPGEYRVHLRYGGRVIPHQPSAAELAVANAALAAAPGDVTYARVDLVAYGERPTVMELELIEPELFLQFDPGAARCYAQHIAVLV
jgi:glutathione synthase/RimK-type ligase-like ATP-grasp enzyme